MPLKLSENDVEAQICDFLRAHRWTVTRQQVGTFIPLREHCLNHLGKDPDWPRIHPVKIGIKGMCDWRAERPVTTPTHKCGLVQAFEFEVKAPGKRPSKEQEAYIASRKWSGFEADWFDCFRSIYPPGEHSEHRFTDWYGERFE